MANVLVNVHELTRGLRLMNELRAWPRGSVGQRTAFLRGVADLVGAQVGIWVEVAGMKSGPVVLRDAVDVGWSGERERAIFTSYMQAQSESTDPTLPRLAARTGEAYACTRQELLEDRGWYRSPHVQDYRRAAGVDHFLIAARPHGDRAQAMSLHRPWGERAFNERERLLLEIVYREAAPLLTEPTPLPPRHRAVLDGLCRGLAEKEIAYELGLSPHTVHGYVKELYRLFDARSRGELLAKTLAR